MGKRKIFVPMQQAESLRRTFRKDAKRLNARQRFYKIVICGDYKPKNKLQQLETIRAILNKLGFDAILLKDAREVGVDVDDDTIQERALKQAHHIILIDGVRIGTGKECQEITHNPKLNNKAFLLTKKPWKTLLDRSQPYGRYKHVIPCANDEMLIRSAVVSAALRARNAALNYDAYKRERNKKSKMGRGKK